MDKIDFSFISSLEGGRQLKGYVPASGTSNSGVTIATGFDLGARNESDLRQLDLPSALINKLIPYLGLKKQAAQAALEEAPLTITAEEAEIIETASRKNSTDTLIRRYNAAIVPGLIAFSQLPGAAQTVIASVAYQYGDLASRAPKFWKTVTAQNWTDAVAELKNFGDHYPTRRHKEADLLESMLS